MRHQMLFKQIVIPEFFFASFNWTCYGGWAGVSFRMQSQTRSVKEAFVAMMALVGFG